jgi:hypothetical protein
MQVSGCSFEKDDATEKSVFDADKMPLAAQSRGQLACSLKHFHKYCDVVRAGYVQSFFDGTPAKSAAPSLTPFVKMR